MTTAITTPTPADVPQTPSSSTDFTSCSRPGCNWTFKPTTGFVPGLETLYRTARETGVERSKPLTRTEILSTEFCARCKKLASFSVFATAGTLALMERWAAENVERKERFLDNKAAFEARQHARNLALAIKREDKSPMNALFATLEKKHAKHGKTGRKRSHAPRREAVSQTVSEPKRGKGKKEQGGGKRKGGR